MSIVLPNPKIGELYPCILQELDVPKGKLVAAYLGVGTGFCYEIEGVCRFCGLTLEVLMGLQYNHPTHWEALQGEGFSGEILKVQPVKPVFDESLLYPFYYWVDDGDPISIVSINDLKILFSFCLRHCLLPQIETIDRKVVQNDNRDHCLAMASTCFSFDISLQYETRILFEKIDTDLKFSTMEVYRRQNKLEASKSPEKKIYVLGDLDRGVIKIGISENINNRVLGVQTGYPYSLTLLWSSSRANKNAHKTEQKLHNLLADFRLTGEWFDSSAFQIIDWSSLG